MHINFELHFDRIKGTWHVWNRTDHSEFFIQFDDRDDALDFMVKMIAEAKE